MAKKKSSKSPALDPKSQEGQAVVEPEPPAPEPLPDVRDHTYVVAPGCSVCCSGRIRGPGAAVQPSDLHNDPAVASDAFDAHLTSGVIVAVE